MDLWNNVTDWLTDHDQQLDLALGWYLAVGFAILAIVEAITWVVIRRQHDRTEVGQSLKHKKIAGATMFTILSSLYFLGLAAYYTKNTDVFGLWQRMGIRLLLAFGVGAAVAAGILFIKAFRSEQWGQP